MDNINDGYACLECYKHIVSLGLTKNKNDIHPYSIWR